MIKKFLAFCLIIILTLPASAEEWLAIANKYEALSIENPEMNIINCRHLPLITIMLLPFVLMNLIKDFFT